ncbi:GbsR/MarR family transcriptional regulator [Actinocrispum wychmicini]|uniref:MarR family protein n=1 Tax=Actinocrispum wychmicini TaxID=1213861 RepID=A0A4R2JIP3_9PSEU|nr:MarR family transcriptional regulator [Actinocrispum wychmicini]TCO58312.1 MarR family protein [Actinocrispum wychmicini]
MADTSSAAEQLALTLSRNGLQKMTARVLAAMLFSERETITAGEIAEQLDASPGSVSVAIKTLSGVGLVERVPAPGSRREHYRFPDDGWARLMSDQNTVVRLMRTAAEDGIEAAGEGSVASRRLVAMRDFYAHVMRELPAVIDRWRESRKPDT